MKNLIHILIIALFTFQSISAQDVTTVEAKSNDISDNLNLEVIASVFGESEDLEDFEHRLNDPELRISNLDLNGDGYVDYLRVVENSESQTILITIQAVIGKDLYQDVATIDVAKDNNGKSYVQVVGDVYMYGQDYIIEPVYIYSPPVVLYLWGPRYRRWYSPYYWNYYPSYYHSWHPYTCHVYRNHIHVHINYNNRYYYQRSRRSRTAAHIHNTYRRNDYGRSYPDRTFTARNSGVRNTYELNRNRGISQASSRTRSDERAVNSSYSARSRASTSNRSYSSTQTSKASTARSNTSSGQVNRHVTNTTNVRHQSQGSSNQRRSSNAGVSRNKSSRSNSQGVRESRSKQSSRSSGRSSVSSRNKSGKSGGERSNTRKSGGSKSSERNRRR